MYIFDLFRSFLPAENPIGFGVADFIELALALMLALFAFGWRWLEPYAVRLARSTGWCMLLLAVLPVAFRAALLSHHPIPSPDIYDEFSHLLVADTLRHFRFANPPHPLSQFFETFFVLQRPTYSSIYPLGQGLMMAVGRMIFGTPWAGVSLSVAAFCALSYWMLRGWTTPGWALLGGVLAIIEFGPLGVWMNSYWGGAFAADGGCLVFGALPRLRQLARARDAILLGLGMTIDLLTRPYESMFVVLGVVLFFAPELRHQKSLRRLAPAAALAAMAVLPAIAATLLQNKEVTGSWTTLPYVLSQYQYGVPAPLTVQANVVPHRELTPQQALDYKMQRSFHGERPETLMSFVERLEYRVRFYRFFFLPPLYIALAAFLWRVREYRFAWAAGTLLLFAIGINFFPVFQFHYCAPVACLFLLASVAGLELIGKFEIRGAPAGQDACRLIVFLCVAHFVFWYGLHAFVNEDWGAGLRRFETYGGLNHGNPERRILVNRELAKTHGKQLVFVRYYPQHIFQDEWVWNEADIDAARVVWARDLGDAENEKLRRYYPDRSVWLLEPDFPVPRLSPYPPPAPPRSAASTSAHAEAERNRPLSMFTDLAVRARFGEQYLVHVRQAVFETYGGCSQIEQPGPVSPLVNQADAGPGIRLQTLHPLAARSRIMHPETLQFQRFKTCVLGVPQDI